MHLLHSLSLLGYPADRMRVDAEKSLVRMQQISRQSLQPAPATDPSLNRFVVKAKAVARPNFTPFQRTHRLHRMEQMMDTNAAATLVNASGELFTLAVNLVGKAAQGVCQMTPIGENCNKRKVHGINLTLPPKLQVYFAAVARSLAQGAERLRQENAKLGISPEMTDQYYKDMTTLSIAALTMGIGNKGKSFVNGVSSGGKSLSEVKSLFKPSVKPGKESLDQTRQLLPTAAKIKQKVDAHLQSTRDERNLLGALSTLFPSKRSPGGPKNLLDFVDRAQAHVIHETRLGASRQGSLSATLLYNETPWNSYMFLIRSQVKGHPFIQSRKLDSAERMQHLLQRIFQFAEGKGAKKVQVVYDPQFHAVASVFSSSLTKENWLLKRVGKLDSGTTADPLTVLEWTLKGS